MKLGGPKLAAMNEARQKAAIARAKVIASFLAELAGMSARRVAAELNARTIKTPTGGAVVGQDSDRGSRAARLIAALNLQLSASVMPDRARIVRSRAPISCRRATASAI